MNEYTQYMTNSLILLLHSNDEKISSFDGEESKNYTRASIAQF